jgi:hypothetical protein
MFQLLFELGPESTLATPLPVTLIMNGRRHTHNFIEITSGAAHHTQVSLVVVTDLHRQRRNGVGIVHFNGREGVGGAGQSFGVNPKSGCRQCRRQ